MFGINDASCKNKGSITNKLYRVSEKGENSKAKEYMTSLPELKK